MTQVIKISVTAGKLLVFELNDIKRLRALGIGGVLIGTLPTAPQQNIFLGLPLQLMVEEVIWLLEQNLVVLIPDKLFISSLVDDLSEEDIRCIQKKRSDSFQKQKQLKIELKKEKLKSVNQMAQKTPNDALIAQSLFINISDTPSHLPNYEFFKSIYVKNTKLQSTLLESLQYYHLNYIIFKHLKESGYFLAPGLRFGGKFIGYPGDPLRYHAHLIVNTVQYEKDIGLMRIVNGGRLATGVKKIWLIGSEEDGSDTEAEDKDDKPICFSVEWAGFG